MIKGKVRLVIPTAINVATMVNDRILAARKRGLTAELVLPSLRKRAKMIVTEEGVIPVVSEDV